MNSPNPGNLIFISAPNNFDKNKNETSSLQNSCKNLIKLFSSSISLFNYLNSEDLQSFNTFENIT
jgi:hypothetical protein